MRLSILIAAIVVLLAGQSFACLTADLIESLSKNGGTQDKALYGRPDTQYDWPTPDGRFRIHYDIDGDNAVYHPDEDVNPHDGIPDYVNRTAEYLGQAYYTLVLQIGFDPPPSDNYDGGDSRYDIYLTNIPGLTTPENPSDEYPGRPAFTSFIQLGHDLRNQHYPNDPLPYLKVSVAHEFCHAIQFAYRAYSSDNTPWWFEATANWAEEKVFDDVNDVYFYLPTYFSFPYRSLYRTNQFIYGSWIFPEFLDERYDAQLIVDCWEKFAGFDFAPTAIGYALHEIGTELPYEYCLHVAWNYFTGPNYLEGFYQEGADFDTTVAIAKTYFDYPVEWVSEPVQLENMSSSYIVFRRQVPGKSNLVIQYFTNAGDRQYVVLAVLRNNILVDMSVNEIDNGVPSTFTIPDFSLGSKVVMAPVWPYEGEPNSGYTSYAYTAYLDSTQSSAGDINYPIAGYSLKGAYPNPFNGAVSISFESPQSSSYILSVYDISGRRLDKISGNANSGTNNVNWIPPSNQASGVLFYQIDINSQRLGGKMSLLK